MSKSRSSHSAPGRNRFVEVYGNDINYIYKTKDIICHCTYNPMLYEILTCAKATPDIADGSSDRIRFNQSRSDLLKHFTMAELCVACYVDAISSFATWEQELKDFKKWLQDRDHSRGSVFEIDHADSNQTNCTIYNLSIMPKEWNRDKRAITAIIRQPAMCVSGYYSNEYRIRVRYFGVRNVNGANGVVLCFRCTNAESYVACLQEIKDLCVGYGMPIYNTQNMSRRPCSTKVNVGLSIEGQKELAYFPQDSFTVYEPGIVKSQHQVLIKDIAV